MEPVTIDELERAADEYVLARDSRMSALKSETEAAARLLKLMHQHHRTAYEFDGKVVSISVLEKVKVNRNKGEENGDDED